MSNNAEFWLNCRLQYQGETYVLKEEPYWEGNCLVLPTTTGDLRLLNAYLSSVRYKGLDYESNESVTLVGNQRAWPSNEK